MKHPSLLEKLAAILRRDLLTAMRYRAAFWMLALTMILEIAGDYYLGPRGGVRFSAGGI